MTHLFTPHAFKDYRQHERVYFPEYPEIFSKLNRVLYIGIGDDIGGLEELAQKHLFVEGIDNYICNNPIHFHNQYKDFLKRKNEMLKKYHNLSITQMDARILDFPDEYFDGVIFKRSLSLIGGGGGAKKNERDIILALDNVHNILCGDGLVWIIYAPADIENLTLNKMDLLLNSSSFKLIEDREDYRLYQKVEKSPPKFDRGLRHSKLLRMINLSTK